MGKGILLVPVATLLQRLPPPAFLDQYSLLLDTGTTLDLDAMRRRLERAGYRCVAQVLEHGEFAVRGSLLDLFPMGSGVPFRIDLFDDQIESIRTFDPDTQRSLDKVTQIRLLPAREFPADEAAITRFRQAFRSQFEGDPQRAVIYRDVSNGLMPAGIEYYLPLFLEQTASLFDYLPASACLVHSEDAHAAIDSFRDEIAERYESLRHDIERPLLPPERLYLSAAEADAALSRYGQLDVQRAEALDSDSAALAFATRALPTLRVTARAERPAGALQDFLAGFPGRVLVCAESAGRRESLLGQLREFGLRPEPLAGWQAFSDSDAPLAITVAPLEQGVWLAIDPPLAVITETQLFGERAMQQRRRRPRRDADAIVRNLTDLNLGAPVVHEDHGVGRYIGLQKLEVGGIAAEFLTLEYAGNDKLYVPVASLHLISRYTGSAPETAPLHKLGSDQWQKARRKAAQRVHDVAAELLDIYARRAARKGYAFPVHSEEYNAFASTFPFEETPDQAQAIEAVLADMAAPQPMDRVVCGDVGFGKTEVAMRAAFVAAQAGRQVAVLVPTTLLAQQHYQNFSDRFADWPMHIDVLSRFRNKKQQDRIIAGFANGTLDILIGTHKILQDDVRAKNLGLVIIDEEHRFGVRQKEKLKALRAQVDLLTLTATPIPRTMNMSLSGLRDLSIIATPPVQRLAIKTFISEWNAATVREACLREIKRGGQVYFLHNEVESIDKIARELRELVPEATLEIGHGQMRERELEQVMSDFYHKRFNVLVCTTIIESEIRLASLDGDSTRVVMTNPTQAIFVDGYLLYARHDVLVAHPFDPGRQEQIQKHERRKSLRRLAVAALGAMQVMMLSAALYVGDWSGMEQGIRSFFRWIGLLLTTPVLLYSAQSFFRGAWRDLLNRRIGMDVPVSLGILVAFAGSVHATLTGLGEVYYDSVVMFVFFLLVSRYFELMARKRGAETAESLGQALPVMATRLAGDGSQQQVPVAELAVGDRFEESIAAARRQDAAYR